MSIDQSNLSVKIGNYWYMGTVNMVQPFFKKLQKSKLYIYSPHLKLSIKGNIPIDFSKQCAMKTNDIGNNNNKSLFEEIKIMVKRRVFFSNKCQPNMKHFLLYLLELDLLRYHPIFGMALSLQLIN